jgi:membrane-associated phospholipid phosphatase
VSLARAAVASGADEVADGESLLDRRSGARFQAYKWGLSLLAAAVQSVVYFGVGHRQVPRSQTLLLIALDRAIPFWPWTVWFYMPFYVGTFVVCVAGMRSFRLVNRVLVAFAVTMVVSAAAHLLIPAEYPRPVLTAPYPDLSVAFLAQLHHIDPAGNVFPSLHVAQTSLLALVLRRDRPGLGALAVAMATVLAASTLTTKQHFILDVAAGYALAVAAWALVTRPFRQAGR